MPYYAMLSSDIKGLFGPGITKQSIITSLQNDGISHAAKFDELDFTMNKARIDKAKPKEVHGYRAVFDSKFAFLLGTDKQSRQKIGADLMQFFQEKFGDNVEEIGLRVPKPNEWLACVTFVDPAAPATPKFQVVACVGSSALQGAKIPWPKEDTPPQIWENHASYQNSTDYKMIRDVTLFTGRGRWF